MIFCNGRVIFPDGVKEGVCVRVVNGRIEVVGEGAYDEQVIDLNGKYLSPAFVDIHTHGGFGGDFMDADKNAFDNVCRFHLSNGTASLLATSVTSSVRSLRRFTAYTRKYVSEDMPYARVLGAHLEGPFLSVKNKGAQKQEYLLEPSKDSYQFIIDDKDIVKTVTVSPELDIDGQMTKALTDNGIIVCGGHDDGIYPEFMPSINNGLKHLTHIFCAMSFVDFKNGVRNVGLREYGLMDDNLTAEIIADNKHIPPELARLIFKCKGSKGLALVSDSLRCAGQPKDGATYKLGAVDEEDTQLVKVSDGVAVLADGSRFAGSITPVSQMVKNVVNAGIDLASAVRMASLTPAEIIGESGIGSIENGKLADLCVMDDQLIVKEVYLAGKLKAVDGKCL